MITFLLVVFGIVSIAVASVLIKYAVMPQRKISISEPLSLILNIPLWTGIIFYGIAFVLYALTLQRLPLNVTHPILTCGAITMVAVLSVILFGESFSLTKIVGVILVSLGVILISWKI
jgi:small multidrug resistance pump